MCKKWYQLITCTEPVGALNRRSFLCPKPRTQFRDAGLSVFTACLDNSAGFCRCLDVFRRFSAGRWSEMASNQRFFCRYSNRFCRLQIRNASVGYFLGIELRKSSRNQRPSFTSVPRFLALNVSFFTYKSQPDFPTQRKLMTKSECLILHLLKSRVS